MTSPVEQRALNPRRAVTVQVSCPDPGCSQGGVVKTMQYRRAQLGQGVFGFQPVLCGVCGSEMFPTEVPDV